MGGTDNDLAFSIQQTADHGYIVAGFSISTDGDVTGNHGGPDYWIVKLFPENVSSISNLQIPNSKFQIFPNPSSGIFQITFPQNQKSNCTLEVINTLGQIVFTSPPASALGGRGESSALPLDLSFLPKGMYVLKINDGVSAYSKKLVIE